METEFKTVYVQVRSDRIAKLMKIATAAMSLVQHGLNETEKPSGELYAIGYQLRELSTELGQIVEELPNG